MNGGVHDAFNLTEKIDHVERDGGDPRLFDLYTRQRKHVALEAVQAQAARNQKLMDENDPQVRLANFREIQEIAADPARAHAFLMKSAMIDGLRHVETFDLP